MEKNLRDSAASPPLLRPEQLAERWGTSTGRLANLRCYGQGPKFVRIGTSIRYRLSDVESYEDANTVVPVGA